MTAPVGQVKEAAAQAVADNPDADVRTLTMKAFQLIYRRPYDSRCDTTEYARIKWHVQRVGYVGPGRGGNRGGGRPKGASAWPKGE